MSSLNLTNIFYIAYRLFPFILVSFFTLSSLLNQDLKGIIYLAGLLIACFSSSVVGNLDPFKRNNNSSPNPNSNTDVADYTKVCNALVLGESGPFSNIPLSMTVFSYTFFYLIYVIGKYNLASQNVISIIIFTLLIIVDGVWNVYFNCNTKLNLLVALIIGGGIGALWSFIIDSTKQVELQYFNGIANKNVCKVSPKQKFRCTTTSS
jgi:hypothetical protein